MKQHNFGAIVLLLFINVLLIEARSALTYTFSGGRFGDNLLTYCRTKWMEYQTKIRIKYIPFLYSDYLMMHILEEPLSQDWQQQFKGVISYQQANGWFDPNSDILYVIPFFPESVWERNCPRNPYLFDVNWNDPEFRKELRKMIKPIGYINPFSLPQDCITIAVHVRRGTGFDIFPGQTFADIMQRQPFKWPPDSFYIENIKKIADIFLHEKIYVYIFTDHDNPLEIMEYYQQAINDDRISFDCRRYQNKHDLNVLEDFFALTQFDCLIRPDSHFSFIASLITDYKIVIAPAHAIEKDGQIVIDQIVQEYR